mmetsp:Transcript_24611/g.38012  ORF Transcript_24611/g.38012 Transcript_24611/m.38012 type:complete len:160 (-) Transcript_24611:129-608(-)
MNLESFAACCTLLLLTYAPYCTAWMLPIASPTTMAKPGALSTASRFAIVEFADEQAGGGDCETTLAPAAADNTVTRWVVIDVHHKNLRAASEFEIMEGMLNSSHAGVAELLEEVGDDVAYSGSASDSTLIWGDNDLPELICKGDGILLPYEDARESAFI